MINDRLINKGTTIKGKFHENKSNVSIFICFTHF